MKKVEVIRSGILDIQVCCEKDIPFNEIEQVVNEESPTGISSRTRQITIHDWWGYHRSYGVGR